MKSEEPKSSQMEQDRRRGQPYRVRLPGFVSDQEIGLGDVIKQATSAIGIQPCGGCDQRAAMLNRWLVFSPWSQR
jgi:hypothetical protein